ncbi:hypothetical protein I6F35_23740 [Bradyrhizobium sp. BRP22]|uniref:hypothetical protein n=1 Tax=Bradyrhizobium sp. BRP22 TaxID=2793821 RepID=UPI001CD220EE|nr:hypothetical protein [Bradyrhizobium sp. BRP22]MCA1456182.1 hypothetical protein [Bradyrhizobium sp. BRP22]
MTSKRRSGWAWLPVLAAGFGFAMVLPAAAQTSAQISPWSGIDNPTPAAAEAAPESESSDADVMKDVDVDKLDWSLLSADASSSDTVLTSRKAAAPKKADSSDAAWSENNNANGTSAVSVKQSISPFWDTRIGADMTIARQGTGTLTNSELLSERLANGGSLPQSSGTAWAAVTAPGVASIWDKTSVEARVDPGSDQTRFGTSLSKSVPLADQYSLTLQNGYNLIQQGVVPVPGIVSHPSRSYEADQSARLSINDLGTSFIAGQTLATGEDKWLHRIGAEQKLFDGITISGSIGETAQGPVNRSLTAGFKRSW